MSTSSLVARIGLKALSRKTSPGGASTWIVTVSAFAATLITATLANADVSDSKGPPQMTVPTERSARPADAPKSEDTALDLSLGGTAASVAIAAIGIGTDNAPLALLGVGSSLLTPSLGWRSTGPDTAAEYLLEVSADVAVIDRSRSTAL